jgi:hypothetical protein
MPSVKSNILIEQGATFIEIIDLLDANGNPIPTLGMSANAALKKWYTSSNVTILSTALANGSLTVSLTANQTANLWFGRYVWDAYLTDVSNNVIRLVEGVATVSPGVTSN